MLYSPKLVETAMYDLVKCFVYINCVYYHTFGEKLTIDTRKYTLSAKQKEDLNTAYSLEKIPGISKYFKALENQIRIERTNDKLHNSVNFINCSIGFAHLIGFSGVAELEFPYMEISLEDKGDDYGIPF